MANTVVTINDIINVVIENSIHGNNDCNYNISTDCFKENVNNGDFPVGLASPCTVLITCIITDISIALIIREPYLG